MFKTKIVALAALASVSVVGASELADTPAGVVGSRIVAEDPCAPSLTPPTTNAPPAAPTNLRIIWGSGGGEETAFDGPESASGPYVAPEPDLWSMAGAGGPHAYFDMLSTRADCLVAYNLRSQAQIDSLATAGRSDIRMPVEYDPVMDAMLTQMDPSGASPHSGSTDGQKKSVRILATNSMLLTWDFQFDEGFTYTKSTDLGQHKAWKIDSVDEGAAWIVIKANYARGANTGGGLASLIFTSNASKWNGPGTTNSSSETFEPRLTEFMIKANKWTRAWIYVEGTIGGGVGGELVYMSAWAADEDREPVQIYNRLAMYTPAKGFDRFHAHYDSSQDVATNGLMKSWNRNLVMLQGLTPAEVQKLLQKPVR